MLFRSEQAEVSTRYAAVVLDDWQRFRRLRDALGPTLGTRPADDDLASSPARALFGPPIPSSP